MKNALLSILAAVLMVPALQSARQAAPIYLDPAKPLDERVGDLIDRLTLAEKILGRRRPRSTT